MGRLPLLAACLIPLLGTACRPPRPVPVGWDARAEQASSAAALGVDERRRPDYQEGFRNGARMIDQALRLGRRPFQPVFGGATGPATPLGGLPEGTAVLPDAPAAEVDPATGFPLRKVFGEVSNPFAQGQVEGFRWALEQRRGELEAVALLRPFAAPRPPQAWTPWPLDQPGLTLDGTARGNLRWDGDRLAWEVGSDGFPPVRCWRFLPTGCRPRFLAVEGGLLWIEAQDRALGALALDLATGYILATVPTLHREAPPSPDVLRSTPQDVDAAWEAQLDQEEAAPEMQARRAKLKARAAAGDADACLELAELQDWRKRNPERNAEKRAWLETAARQGRTAAMVELGTTLFHGLFLPKDPVAARAWLDRAVEAGDPAAREILGALWP